MRKLANGEETVVLVPVIVEPIEVEVTLVAVPVEVRHVAVIQVTRDRTVFFCTQCRLCHYPLTPLTSLRVILSLPKDECS